MPPEFLQLEKEPRMDIEATGFTFGLEIETVVPAQLAREGLRIGSRHGGVQVP